MNKTQKQRLSVAKKVIKSFWKLSPDQEIRALSDGKVYTDDVITPEELVEYLENVLDEKKEQDCTLGRFHDLCVEELEGEYVTVDKEEENNL